MSILYIMIPLSLILMGFAGWAFFWAVGSGQFDDLESPGWDVLRDADEAASGGSLDPGMSRRIQDADPGSGADLKTGRERADPDTRPPDGENDRRHSGRVAVSDARQAGNRPDDHDDA